MEFPKQIVILIVKIAVVLFIPYFWIYNLSGSFHPSTSSAVTGTWGQWVLGGYPPIGSAGLTPIWELNQPLFALLFMLPMILFSFFYGQKELDRTWIAASGLSVFLSFIITDLLTPDSIFGVSVLTPNLVVPNVVSLGIFVFVFWPLLRNSWPSRQNTEDVQKKQGNLSKLRAKMNELVPINIATLVWVSMVIFPAIMTISGIVGSVSIGMYDLRISGGLSTITFDYSWATSGGAYPFIHSTFMYVTASWISLSEIFFWILNLLLGVTTLRFIMGKSTQKQVRILAIAIILIYAIPSLFMDLTGFGIFMIPLPFYPIIMLIVAKFVHAPAQGYLSEDIIQVPLRTRISSIFSRKTQEQENQNIEGIEEDDEDISSS